MQYLGHTYTKKILFFGCAVRLVGFQFPDQEWNPGHGSESTKS